MTNPPPTSPKSRAIEWLIAAAAAGALLTFAVVLFWPEPQDPATAPAAVLGAAAPLPPPRLAAAPAQQEEAPIPASELDLPVANPKACEDCQEKHRGQHKQCVKDLGCDGLAGEEKTLCEDLLKCLLGNPRCFREDPAKCYCGPSEGMKCLSEPKGICAQQGLAATKTSDTTQAAIRFFRPDFPSGRATQVAACRARFCKDECRGTPAGG